MRASSFFIKNAWYKELWRQVACFKVGRSYNKIGLLYNYHKAKHAPWIWITLQVDRYRNFKVYRDLTFTCEHILVRLSWSYYYCRKIDQYSSLFHRICTPPIYFKLNNNLKNKYPETQVSCNPIPGSLTSPPGPSSKQWYLDLRTFMSLTK